MFARNFARNFARVFAIAFLGAAFVAAAAERGQTEGINDPYLAPDLKITEWVERFQGESREVFAHRHKIAASLDLKPGQSVADVGAGTGLYVPFLADRVGKSGKVYAVDISRPFLEYIAQKARENGLSQVATVAGNERSIELPVNSVDMIFTSDAYHHFTHYQDMLASMRKALKPGGQLIVVDYDIEAEGLDPYVIEHVGKKKSEFRRQIEENGFKFAQDMTLKEMKTNFIYRFVKQ
jgi:ubiquinone/menaquinone biosynthesis C-methylase UbiE